MQYLGNINESSVNISIRYIRFLYKIGIVTIIITALSLPLTAQTKHFSVSEEYEYTIESSSKGQYSAELIYRKAMIFKTPASCELPGISISSGDFLKLNKLRLSYHDEHYSKSDLTKITPESPDVVFADESIYRFALPSTPKVNDFISYEAIYTIPSISFMSGVEIGSPDSISTVRISVKHPKELRVQFLVHRFNGRFDYSIDSVSETETVFAGIVRDMAEDVPFYPAGQVMGFVQFSIQNNNEELLPINAAATAHWYGKLTPLNPKLDSTNRNLLADTIQKARTENEKLKIIYDYVRENFRYATDTRGLSGLVPRSMYKIIESRLADCKERAALICALAERHNLRVLSALYPDKEEPVSGLVYATKYNHVVNVLIGAKDTVFIDATNEHAPYGWRPEHLVDEELLLLDSLNPRVVQMFDDSPNPALKIGITAHIDTLQKSRARIVLKGNQLVRFRNSKSSRNAAMRDNSILNSINLWLHKIQLEAIDSVHKSYDSVVIYAACDMSKFIIKTAVKQYVPQNAFSLWDAKILRRSEDTLPVVLQERLNASLTVAIKGIPAVTLPQQAVYGNPQDDFLLTAGVNSLPDNSVLLNYSSKQTRRVFKGADKQRFIATLAEYSKQRKQLFQLGAGSAK